MCISALLCLSGGECRAATWEEETYKGVSYTKMTALRSFFSFSSLKSTRKGFSAMGTKDMKLEYRLGQQDIYLNNLRFILSYPIIKNAADEELISMTDLNKVINPVVRPQYIKNAGNLKCVIIDAGHGGHDAGACGNAVREADLNLALAKKLKKLLLKSGFHVIMTRETDIFLTLQQRVEIANRYSDAIFVCIHHNSAKSLASGIETFTLAPHGTTSPFARTKRDQFLRGNEQDSTNIALAAAVHSTAVLYTKAVDRGIQRARFSVLCTIKHPAILFEAGFVTNARENRLLTDPNYQDRLALALHNGIVRYRNVMMSKPGTAKSPSQIKRTSVRGTPSKPTSISPGKADRLKKAKKK